jgi:hypothetical protein
MNNRMRKNWKRNHSELMHLVIWVNKFSNLSSYNKSIDVATWCQKWDLNTLSNKKGGNGDKIWLSAAALNDVCEAFDYRNGP